MINELIHLGIGVENADNVVAFLRKGFGFDVKAADIEGSQPVMNCYTNGELMHRRSMIVGNFQGGALLELIQPMSTKIIEYTPKIGDYGVYIAKIRSYATEKSHQRIKELYPEHVSDIYTEPLGRKTFFARDPENNIYQVVGQLNEEQICLSQGKDTGGVLGCAIGVSDIEAAKKFYHEVLGYEVVGQIDHGSNDWNNDYLGECNDVSRVFMTKKTDNAGLLSTLLGNSEIELIQTHDDRKPIRILEDRRWGDNGFVHVCFDSSDSDKTKTYLDKKDIEITTGTRVNWNGIDSEFFYFEDPDRCYVEVNAFYSLPIFNPLRIKYRIKKDKIKPLSRNWYSIIKMNMKN